MQDSANIPSCLNGHGAGYGLPKKRKIRAWRIGVLLGLNLLILTHIILQKMGAVSYGHNDPLDFMRFIETGAVSIGFLLLVVWIISIPLFGRVLCGWFCHMAAWQELGHWLLSRTSFRQPKIINSRILKWFIPSLCLAGLILVPLAKAWFTHTGDAQGLHWSTGVGRPVWELGALKAVIILFTFLFFTTAHFGIRTVCRFGCPFSPVFRPLQRFSLFKIRKVGQCTECGMCSRACLMGIDTMNEIQQHGFVRDTECVGCQSCVQVCDHGAIRYTTRSAAMKPVGPAPGWEPRPSEHPVLDLKTELFLLPFVMVGVIVGVPGIVWGTLFMLCSAATLLALVGWLRARRSTMRA